MKPDKNDFMILIGTGTLGTGLWMIEPSLALIVVGGLVLIFGLAGEAAKGRNP